MGDMRKDYVLEREVIVHPTTKKNTNTKKCPYCPGNESMTNPSLLALVAKDGMLQRLQDSEDFFVKIGLFVYLKVKNQLFQYPLKIHIVIDHCIANLHMAITTL